MLKTCGNPRSVYLRLLHAQCLELLSSNRIRSPMSLLMTAVEAPTLMQSQQAKFKSCVRMACI